jgi:hypothetical protein
LAIPERSASCAIRCRCRSERRECLRRLDHAGERRGLGERQVDDVLAEVEPRRFGEAVHRERAAVAEVHLVQVQLEDLILGQPALRDHRHELFAQLARHALLGREQQVLHELLRQRAPAHEVRLVAFEVRDHRRRGSDEVDPGVVVEAAILDREDGVAHVLRDLLQRHLAPLLAARGDERGEERRLQRRPADGHAVRGALDALDGRRRGAARARARRAEHDADDGAVLLAAADRQRDRVLPDGELAGLGHARPSRVAQVVQALDQPLVGHRLPGAQLQRPGVDPRPRALDLAVQPRLDHARQRHVVVAEHAHDEEERARERRHQVAQPAPLAADTRRRGGARAGLRHGHGLSRLFGSTTVRP